MLQHIDRQLVRRNEHVGYMWQLGGSRTLVQQACALPCIPAGQLSMHQLMTLCTHTGVQLLKRVSCEASSLHSCRAAAVDVPNPHCIWYELHKLSTQHCVARLLVAQEAESSEAALHSKQAACQAGQHEVASNRLQLEASRYWLPALFACMPVCLLCLLACLLQTSAK